jgi:2-dehydro-3-deoxygluconokinase
LAKRDYDVVTFGETMLRLSAPHFARLEETVSLDVRVGGSESNTAVALARLGLKVAWWSKLPANPMGRRIENEIRRWGVDTSSMLWDELPGARAGLYFLDFGVAPRGIDVYYDRAASSASRITAHEIDASLIANARLLHMSGITPALSPYAAKAVLRAFDVAREAGTRVSFDINYRAKLWSTADARRELEPLLSRIDVLLCPLSDAEALFGIIGSGAEVARTFRERYGVASAVITCGGDGAVACDDAGDWAATPFALGQIVDRVGAGDAFNAGVLMGYLQGDLKTGLEYGTAMAALKHTMPGDLLLSTRAEIEIAHSRSHSSIRR